MKIRLSVRSADHSSWKTATPAPGQSRPLWERPGCVAQGGRSRNTELLCYMLSVDRYSNVPSAMSGLSSLETGSRTSRIGKFVLIGGSSDPFSIVIGYGRNN